MLACMFPPFDALLHILIGQTSTRSEKSDWQTRTVCQLRQAVLQAQLAVTAHACHFTASFGCWQRDPCVTGRWNARGTSIEASNCNELEVRAEAVSVELGTVER